MDELTKLFQRLMACEATRDIEVMKAIDRFPVLHIANRYAKESDLPESERVKVLLCVMAAEASRLTDLANKLFQMQPPAPIIISAH